MCLDLHCLLDVEVLVCSLLRSVLGVLGHCARSLLRLQHHYLGLTMTSRVMGTRNGSLNMSLCYLSKGVGGWDALVAMDAVPRNGVRTLWRRVAWWHVGWGGCRQGA